MGEPSIDTLHDQYEDQLSAARYKAERDAAVQELQGLRERNLELWMDCGMEHELTRCAEDKAGRLGKLVWRLQNRLARSHRREKALRRGMRMWREKAIGGPVHTVSAYDLLPEEDLQTLRWVREHGGMSHVKDIYHDFRAVVERLGIEWSESELHGLMDALDRRLMPEGYEWPRFEDGEPVRISDRATRYDEDFDVRHIATYSDGSFLLNFWTYASGERVKRPAVLAADGEPLEVGQTVYVIANGKTHHVTEIDAVSKRFRSMEQVDGSHWLDPMCFTHQRPVLAADDLLIKEDDMVYSKETVERFEVTGFTNDGFVICWDMDKCKSDIEILPSDLTHTKPEPSDTWERIEQDSGCTVSKYNELRGTIFTTKQQVARDLVRRCKEVARKENNNE